MTLPVSSFSSWPSSPDHRDVKEKPSAEGCPLPLDWKTVLQKVEAERTTRISRLSDGELSVWTLGSGPPLVWLTGAGDQGKLLSLAIWLLRHEYESIVIDTHQLQEIARRSEKTLKALARTLEQLLVTWELNPVPLIGTSGGGAVLLELAAEFPQCAESLILQGTVPHMEWSWTEKILVSWGCHWPGPMNRLPIWHGAATRNHAPWFPPFDPTRWVFLKDRLGQVPVRQFANHLRLLQKARFHGRLASIQIPVTMIQTEGQGSGITQAQQALVSALPQGQIEIMSNSGLFPYLTHPHRFVKLIRTLLTSERRQTHTMENRLTTDRSKDHD